MRTNSIYEQPMYRYTIIHTNDGRKVYTDTILIPDIDAALAWFDLKYPEHTLVEVLEFEEEY